MEYPKRKMKEASSTMHHLLLQCMAMVAGADEVLLLLLLRCLLLESPLWSLFLGPSLCVWKLPPFFVAAEEAGFSFSKERERERALLLRVGFVRGRRARRNQMCGDLHSSIGGSVKYYYTISTSAVLADSL